MRMNRVFVRPSGLAVLLTALLFTPNIAFAHCDGMDGPVVKAAQKALGTGNVSLVLIWVQEKDAPELRRAFDETLAVRKLSPRPKSLPTDTSSRLSFVSTGQEKEHHTLD